jgi:hypothetical protein
MILENIKGESVNYSRPVGPKPSTAPSGNSAARSRIRPRMRGTGLAWARVANAATSELAGQSWSMAVDGDLSAPIADNRGR